jgi:hypothetical protein
MVHVLSWDAKREHVVILDIPNTAVIEGTRGYGKYPLASLLKLDTIDRHEGRVFVESLTDAIGLPIIGYAQLPPQIVGNGSITLVRSIFSWQSLLDTHSRHDISWGTWAAWVFAAHSLKADEVDVVSATPTLVDQTQPDGSTISLLDSSRLDYLYGSMFVDTAIRTENMTVSVYNTTGVPTIGQRAARILTQMGISVVTVGNDDKELSQCEVSGNTASLRSHTGKFMAQYFGCKVIQTDDTSSASDISLHLGKEYAAAFAPKK